MMKPDEARKSVQQCLDDARHGAEVVICDIEAVRTLLDAYGVAVKCIYDVETYGQLGSMRYIKRVIDLWRGPEPGGEVR